MRYKDDSIVSYDSWTHVRHRSGMYLGSNEYSTQLLKEVFYNAVDEHNIGHGNVINITIDKDRFTVEDFGQGFLVNNLRDDGETVLQASFDVINTSGKYDDSDNSVYAGSASGLNGVGGKLANFLSKSMEVTSTDGSGLRETLQFIDGKFSSREITKETKGVTGTKVSWTPDPQFFQNPGINLTEFEALLDEMSALCPNLTINFNNNGTKKVYHYDGIQQYFDKYKEKEILPNRFYIRKEVGTELFDICLTYTSDYSETITAFVNFTKTESGVHIQTLKTAFTQTVNKAIEDSGLYKKVSLLGGDLLEGLTIMFNLKSKNVKHDGQTKSRIVDCNKELINQVMRGDFYDWLIKNPKCLKTIVDRALSAKKAKEAAQKARDIVRNGKQKMKTLNLPTKLVDAYSKDRKECELYICLKGDTKVKLLDGTDVPIESLVGKEDVWIYSTNSSGAMIPAKMKNAFKTQDTTEMIKITFNDDSIVECTPNHKFLDRDTCSWVEAKDLVVGQSMFSMKFKIINDHMNVFIPGGDGNYIATGRGLIKNSYKGQWEAVHIRVAKYLGIAEDYNGVLKDIHHKDFNKLNNNPDNLEYITKGEHLAIHNRKNYDDGIMKYENKKFTNESRKRMQEGVYKRTAEGIKKQKEAVSNAWKAGKYKNATWEIFNSTSRFVNGKDTTQVNKVCKVVSEMLDKNIVVTEESYNNYVRSTRKSYVLYDKAISMFDSYNDMIECGKNYNLKVTKIEYITYDKPIPVYCLNVDNDFHSFVLSNGIITHNCEGDSAASGLIAKRDGKTQAVFPVRGKVISCRKASFDDIYGNQEINNIVKALGLEINQNTRKLIYDPKKLRYSKIILACDADPDGLDIRMLLITAFWWLCEDLVKNGHIYVAIPPLYRVTDKKNNYIFLTGDKELEEYKKKHKKDSFQVNRNKGLGEMDPGELAECILYPTSRNVEQITVEDAIKADEMLEIFMGPKVEPRRKYLLENS